MKIYKVLMVILSLFCLDVYASDIQKEYALEGKVKEVKEEGFVEPIYVRINNETISRDQYTIKLIANPNNFPFSSEKQGSVFTDIFKDLFEKERILIVINDYNKKYENLVGDFERSDFRQLEDNQGLFGVYFKEYKYSKNMFLYPLFMENEVYFITPADKEIDVNVKEDLSKYKGIYVKEDTFSDFVLKDFSKLNIKEVKTWDEAFEKLMTFEVDYMVASYYPSQIKLYKAGLRKYVKFSIDPVWKMPMFIRLSASVIEHPRIVRLKKYLRSDDYKKLRDKTLNNLLELYKENTKGVIPPQYIKNTTPKDDEQVK